MNLDKLIELWDRMTGERQRLAQIAQERASLDREETAIRQTINELSLAIQRHSVAQEPSNASSSTSV
jgi:hypothetical protein